VKIIKKCIYVRGVCEMWARTMAIPIIMVTALHQKKDKIKAIGIFADDFLSKPIDYDEMTTKIKSLLRLKEYHDALTGDTRFLGVGIK
jgi:DNA-binding response OmpR family regulator